MNSFDEEINPEVRSPRRGERHKGHDDSDSKESESIVSAMTKSPLVGQRRIVRGQASARRDHHVEAIGAEREI